MDQTLRDKLKLDKHSRIFLLAQAREAGPFDDLEGMVDQEEGLFDLIIAYVYDLEAMANILDQVWQDKLLIDKGLVYLLYPKVKNKLGHPPIGRDSIFPYLGVDDEGYVKDTELKFNKMVSLDDNYTLIGLKQEAKLSQKKKANQPSQCVADYLDRIPEIIQFLQDKPETLAKYQALTPGYQKDWARHIYSTKTDATQEKRRAQMVEILNEGYKSIDLYRSAQKQQK